MSVFAKYNVLSSTYDDGRYANGADLYLGFVYGLSRKTAEQLYLLDAGCGTGTHTKYLLEQGLGRVAMLDGNEEMLKRARKKLSTYINEQKVTTFIHHCLPVIPFEDNTFDVVMFNQVLHHLDSHDYAKIANGHIPSYPNIKTSIEEAYRVLKPSGVVIINVAQPHQLSDGRWYAKVLPEASFKDETRHPKAEILIEFLRCSGFEKMKMVVVPLDTLSSMETYLDGEGPLNEGWRNADSCCATASEEELQAAAIMIAEMKADGKLEEFVRKADLFRPKIGQYSIFVAIKAPVDTGVSSVNIAG